MISYTLFNVGGTTVRLESAGNTSTDLKFRSISADNHHSRQRATRGHCGILGMVSTTNLYFLTLAPLVPVRYHRFAASSFYVPRAEW
jgi:hypothetical protein